MLSVVATLGLLTVLAAPAAAYEVVSVADGGVLSGTVRFTGTPPRLEPITVSRNRDVCGDTKDAETLAPMRQVCALERLIDLYQYQLMGQVDGLQMRADQLEIVFGERRQKSVWWTRSGGQGSLPTMRGAQRIANSHFISRLSDVRHKLANRRTARDCMRRLGGWMLYCAASAGSCARVTRQWHGDCDQDNYPDPFDLSSHLFPVSTHETN